MANMLEPGDKAPDFTTVAVGGIFGKGKTVSLADFRGKPLVLYFYPKDDTPGCTTQACAIRDNYASLLQKGAVVMGVSVDAAEDHENFISKYNLPFPLLSDTSHALVEAYGVWVEKVRDGKTSMGTERSTYVIRPDGTIQSIFRKVKPEEHTETVLNDLAHFEP